MKLCTGCGKWHIQAPIPEQCECGAHIPSGRVRPPTGEPISGAPIEAEDAGLGTALIAGAIRTAVPASYE